MSDKVIKKTKAELYRMLAEAVRNTQPQPVGNEQPELVREARPTPRRKTQARNMRPGPKRTAKNKSVRR